MGVEFGHVREDIPSNLVSLENLPTMAPCWAKPTEEKNVYSVALTILVRTVRVGGGIFLEGNFPRTIKDMVEHY